MKLFTSDLHFGHSNIIKYCSRPWGDVAAMNEGLIANWNTWVGVDDTVYIVGDMFLMRADDIRPIMEKLRGRKILIRGNHDTMSRTKLLDLGFDEVAQQMTVNLSDGRKALLNHVPLPASTLAHVDMQVHGHLHSGLIVTGKRVNVATDLWQYRPITEVELCCLRLKQPLLDSVNVEVTKDLVKVTAVVRKEDLSGLIDHLQGYSNKLSEYREEW
jgi:calcineurin-like phosphoesterase family protein